MKLSSIDLIIIWDEKHFFQYTTNNQAVAGILCIWRKKQKKKKSWKLQSFAVTRHRRVFWCVLWFAEKIRNTIWLFPYLGVCDQEWANNLLSFIWNWGSSGLDDARLIVAFFYLFSTFILISRCNIWSSKRKNLDKTS